MGLIDDNRIVFFHSAGERHRTKRLFRYDVEVKLDNVFSGFALPISVLFLRLRTDDKRLSFREQKGRQGLSRPCAQE